MSETQQTPPLKHVAVIMDGNGRWAKDRGLPRSAGHRAGVEAARTIITECRKLGIEYLTLYAFSRENWSRPKEEISFLFDLLVRFLKQEQKTLLEQSIRLHVLGKWQELPFTVRQVVKQTLAATKQCDQMVLNVALNYSGREEILEACRNLLRQGASPDQLDEEGFSSQLYTAGQPDPDLLIRTSGELRISNYLTFQTAYTELYFTSTYWPDFNEQSLREALADYGRRRRRFGGIQEA